MHPDFLSQGFTNHFELKKGDVMHKLRRYHVTNLLVISAKLTSKGNHIIIIFTDLNEPNKFIYSPLIELWGH